MLLVKTKLLLSSINNIGLFADEYIKKGTKIWKWDDNIDKIINKQLVNSLPEIQKEYIITYAWIGDDGNYYLCGDNDRFANHSENPTCSSKMVSELWEDIAIKDIKIGEEITYNYWDFHRGNEL